MIGVNETNIVHIKLFSLHTMIGCAGSRRSEDSRSVLELIVVQQAIGMRSNASRSTLRTVEYYDSRVFSHPVDSFPRHEDSTEHEERDEPDAIVEVTRDPLSQNIPRPFRLDELLIRQHVRTIAQTFSFR